MSVQEPQDQFGRESIEDEIEESQDSEDESIRSDSEAYTPSGDAESVETPTDETPSSSDYSTPVEV